MPWLVECAGRFAAMLKCGWNSSGMNVLVDWPAWPTSGKAAAFANVTVGAKPPWNQPHERPALFSSSPMFLPTSATASRVEQSSQYGCASLVSEKPPIPSDVMSAFGLADVAIVTGDAPPFV